ncbi:hypothetical protein [Sinorhizobium sp. BG8]|uniref:hypothetical protein n=1 Tax=Sinorhizobium sp. BG8 TaxID=2613773 RepID=UPI00193D4BE4|nr:hypothetical protein [Sinorhizobium sp. BG8]QRM55423.1 hypothetical protein F3Y30_13485 [Sinorhizobium sp. BG8]
MKAALVIMTILGCDDSATQCHYIDTVKESWQTIALCDAQSEAQINRYHATNYPVVVAVCESSSDPMTAELAPPPASSQSGAASLPQPEQNAPTDAASTEKEKAGIASRTIAMIRKTLPDASAVRNTVTKPVHYIEDGYSWVLHKFAD